MSSCSGVSLDNIGDTYVLVQWFEEISSGTSGTISNIPTAGEIVLNYFDGGLDALISGVSNSFPDFSVVKDSSGTQVTTTLDGSGNWALSSTPSSYPVAIIYNYRIRLSDLDYNSTLSPFEFYMNLGVESINSLKGNITINSTPNQTTVTDNGSDTITIGTSQDINTTSSPSFTGLTLSGSTPSRLLQTDASKALSSASLANFISGTTNRVTVSDDGDGTITLSSPQDIATTSTPQFAGGNFTGVVSGVTPISQSDLATKGYVDSYIQGITWVEKVLDKDLTAPPATPSTGDRYIISSPATGAWASKENDIAEWMGSYWQFTTPVESTTVPVDDEDRYYRFTGTSWSILGSFIDHGNLVGLGDDDHLQYHNDSRALTWLGTRTTSDLPEGSNLYYTDNRVEAYLSGEDGINYSNGVITADISTTNLQFSLGKLNTIQDISTSSSPTFNGANFTDGINLTNADIVSVNISGTAEPGIRIDNTNYTTYDIFSGGGGDATFNNSLCLYNRDNGNNIRMQSDGRLIVANQGLSLNGNITANLDGTSNYYFSVTNESSTNTSINANALGIGGAVFMDWSVNGGNSDYDMRMIRATGANGDLTFSNRGTGSIYFSPSLSNQFSIDSSGAKVIGNGSYLGCINQTAGSGSNVEGLRIGTSSGANYETGLIKWVNSAVSTDRKVLFDTWSSLSPIQIGGSHIKLEKEGGGFPYLGIGLTPSTPLDVSGQGRFYDGTVDMRVQPLGSSGVGILGNVSNHDLVLYSNNSEKMRVRATGDVGIGTSSPQGLLDIRGSGNSVLRLQGGAASILRTGDTGSTVNNRFVDIINDNGGFIVRQLNDDGTNPTTTKREAFVIASDGNSTINQKLTIGSSFNSNWQFTCSGSGTAHFGDATDNSQYGLVQITRPADQPDNKYHLSFIRSGNKIFGMGYLDNSNTFGIQTDNNNSGSTGIFINSSGDLGINTRDTFGNGDPKLCIRGSNGSFTNGPHVNFITDGDDYPLLEIWPNAHNEVWIGFDWYQKSGSTYGKSAYASGNAAIRKNQLGLAVYMNTGTAVGSDIPSGFKIPLNIKYTGSVSIGNGSIATTATDGFLYIPTTTGDMTSTPTSISGYAPIVYNTTANELQIYNGTEWRHILTFAP